MRYGCLKKQRVYLLDRATKSLKSNSKTKSKTKGKLVVQSLATGQTAIVNKSLVKKISNKYPKKGDC